MHDLLEQMTALVAELDLLWLGLVLGLPFVASLLLVPWLLLRLPADYFAAGRRPTLPWARMHPVLRALALLAKNLLGLVVLLMGIAMLVLPGQGLLTMLIGLLLLDFPGKYQLQRWLLQRAPVLHAANWLRQRAGKPPFTL
jgi:hypothetical protein